MKIVLSIIVALFLIGCSDDKAQSGMDDAQDAQSAMEKQEVNDATEATKEVTDAVVEEPKEAIETTVEEPNEATVEKEMTQDAADQEEVTGEANDTTKGM